MKQTLSLALRAVLAVVLMIGFYGLALGIVAMLLGFVYLDVSSGGIHVKGIIGCVLISGLVVYAVMCGNSIERNLLCFLLVAGRIQWCPGIRSTRHAAVQPAPASGNASRF